MTKGKDTLIPKFDYQQKKRVGYKAIKSASSGVVRYVNCCFGGVLCFIFLFLFIQLVSGNSWWHICIACKTAVFTGHSSCCGKLFFSFLNIAMTLSPSLCYQLLRSFKIIQSIYFWLIRLVVFILACFLKFATTLEILVRWITL